jgi:hypothetical protein
MSRSAATLSLAAACLFSTAALAVPRAYVGSYGNDANTATNCGPTTPCRTFATAMTVADIGGQVIVLDSAGYGSVVITKSIAIIAPEGIYAGLTVASGGTAVDIATAAVDVVLKGLTITGQGGGYGISMTAGNSLHVEKTTIAKFTSGTGLRVQTPATAHVVDSVVRDNAYGIVAGTGATVGVIGSRVLNNSSEGIEIRTSAAGTGVTTTININDSVVSGSGWCVNNWEVSGNVGVINATRVTVSMCSSVGFLSTPEGAGTMTVSGSSASDSNYGFAAASGLLTVSGSTASNNTTGFYRTGGLFVSSGNNWVYGNTTNTSGTITPAALQ